jgi:hypothetical protein
MVFLRQGRHGVEKRAVVLPAVFGGMSQKTAVLANDGATRESGRAVPRLAEYRLQLDISDVALRVCRRGGVKEYRREVQWGPLGAVTRS